MGDQPMPDVCVLVIVCLHCGPAKAAAPAPPDCRTPSA